MSRKRTTDKTRANQSSERDLLDIFNIDNPVLAAKIDDAALTSGGYPYSKRLERKVYERDLVALQIELLKLQNHVRQSGERIVIVFEGRDSAGKGGTIKRFMEHLNPRHARAVALTKPSEVEKGQWYFQRYVAHMPTSGEIVLFDRSWYNRAGVERVMGFCDEGQLADFLREAPLFEGQLVRDGIRLFKLFLTIGQEMQLKRLHARRHDPLKHWKLSPIDLKGLEKWDDYTKAKEEMFRFTHTETTPWMVVRANDKRRARLAAIRHVLSGLNYVGKDESVVGTPDPKIVGRGDEYFSGS